MLCKIVADSYDEESNNEQICNNEYSNFRIGIGLCRGGYLVKVMTNRLLGFVIVAFIALDSQGSDSPFITCGDDVCNTQRETCIQTTDTQFRCSCRDGYTGENCVENRNECQNGTESEYPCAGPEGSSFCVNKSPPSKYRCGCVEGYIPVLADNITTIILDPVPLEWRPIDCKDIDECTNSTLNTCIEDSVCQNTNGSYICVCTDTNSEWNGDTCVKSDVSPTETPESVGIQYGSIKGLLIMAFVLILV
jgi:Calcium-binding EGF domain